jgi:Na+/H+ antiporter NhaD/arsenite permease-like protein
MTMTLTNRILLIVLAAAPVVPGLAIFVAADGTRAAATLTLVAAFVLAALEERTGLRKSQPMLLTAGIVWGLIALGASPDALSVAEDAFREALVGYAGVMLFVLVTMTYWNALVERRVFAALRFRIRTLGWSYRAIYYALVAATFALAPLLTDVVVAALFGGIAYALRKDDPRFVAPACVGVVIAANAGATLSPYGAAARLAGWPGLGGLAVPAPEAAWLPAAVAVLVPALAIARALPDGGPDHATVPDGAWRGGWLILTLLVATVGGSIALVHALSLPAAAGMMTGFALLQFLGFYLRRTQRPDEPSSSAPCSGAIAGLRDGVLAFDIFHRVACVQWDTLLYLGGWMIAVGGLHHLGVTGAMLGTVAALPGWLGDVLVGPLVAFWQAGVVTAAATQAAAADGIGSSVLWLATSLGGSLLALGSLTGITLMGISGGRYTFLAHLRWTPAILVGYLAALALDRMVLAL